MPAIDVQTATLEYADTGGDGPVPCLFLHGPMWTTPSGTGHRGGVIPADAPRSSRHQPRGTPHGSAETSTT